MSEQAMILRLRTALAAAVCTCATTAGAADYYLKSVDNPDWGDVNSYALGSLDGGTPSALPGGDDFVHVRRLTRSSFVPGTSSFDTFANVKGICFDNWSDVAFDVTVPAGQTADLNGSFVKEGTFDDTSYRFATLILKGGGDLRLMAQGDTARPGNRQSYAYYVNLVVRDGSSMILHPTGTGLDGHGSFVGVVTVADEASVFYLAKDDVTEGFLTYPRGLAGVGVVTNASTCRADLNMMVMRPAEKQTFAGRIAGAVRLAVSGPARFAGADSVTPGMGDGVHLPFEAYCARAWSSVTEPEGVWAVVEATRLGCYGEASSLGSGDVVLGSNGGWLRYVGDGETVNKSLLFRSNIDLAHYPAVIDGGEHGNLTFGSASRADGGTSVWAWDYGYSGTKYNQRVMLTGENALGPCRVQCAVQEGKYVPTGAMKSLQFRKCGTGTWVFEGDATNSTNAGGIQVDEGTLSYASLAPKGERSALGTATNVTRYMTTPASESDLTELLPYAFRLGGTNSLAPGMLDYIGTARSLTDGRTTVLSGVGGFSNSGTAPISFTGVTALETGGRNTLVLGGSHASSDNVLYDVTNGVGHIAVVKRDVGTWRLANNIDVDSVSVEGGTLILEKTTGADYTWFRFIEQEALNIDDIENGTADSPKEVGPYFPVLEEFVLQDASGVRQLVNPVYRESVSDGGVIERPNDYRLLEPNALAYGKRGALSWDRAPQDRGASNLFDNAASPAGMWLNRYNGSRRAPTAEDPETWIDLVMRLPEGAPRITSCDLVAGKGGPWGSELGAWALEGCRDGVHWEPITNVSARTSGGYVRHRLATDFDGCWYGATDRGLGRESVRWTTGDTTPRPGMGYPFAGVVTNAYVFPATLASVRISGGGTLKVVADVPPTVQSLTVDATTGGTVENVVFAAVGEIALVRVPKADTTEVPVSFVNAQGLANLANWTATFDGKARSYELDVVDGRLRIRRKGLLILFR